MGQVHKRETAISNIKTASSWDMCPPLHALVPPTGEHQLPLTVQTHPAPSKQMTQ
jgi:hypothetical protein